MDKEDASSSMTARLGCIWKSLTINHSRISCNDSAPKNTGVDALEKVPAAGNEDEEEEGTASVPGDKDAEDDGSPLNSLI